MLRRFFSTSRSLKNSLVFVEGANGQVSPSTLSTITAATQIGEPVTAVVVDQNLAESASKLSGVSKVLKAQGPQYAHYLSEEISPLLQELIKKHNFTHFFVSGSAVGKSILPRLGALLDVQPLSDITKVIDKQTFTRPIYAGNAIATVKSKDSIILATVRASAFAPASEQDAVSIEDVTETPETGNRTEFVSEELVSSERPELGSASTVIAGGRGLKNKETFDALVEPLATKLNAAIGASRAAVDSGYCDNSLQVGQTGKIVAPDLYIAVGISGAIQHLAGMKDSKVIVAINKDPEAPIFNIADVGLVGDLNEVVPELTEKI
ncbi:Electron transfer flavoprotein alpha-subunit [Lodderomyces elongisporus]|uniref:Electron transfer flavoprotein alpha-subunit n=1 Tax=Lodderomyces elongisporus TaxID=36914 RepID=UPI002920A2A5|nr:Electron transfer flavoprotein alpha-subunit [Lodderomyces elongisporus]WLF79404.1 Electron transfer flavoprotein alpha-subunit [Lodderomyces elongisporus]